jgi:tetratricopeptide (TPR) repeat protein
MPALLGEALLGDDKPADAAVVLQAEANRRPESSRLQSALGRAYVRSGQVDKGVAALHESVVLEPGPNIRALAAAELADARRDLDKALDYADLAVKQTFSENETSEFARLPPGASTATRRLGFYMEVLGRVLLARREYPRAQVYCQAAWDLAQRYRAAACLAELAAHRRDVPTVERYRAQVRGANHDYLPGGGFDPVPKTKPTIPTPPAEAQGNFDAFNELERLRTFSVARPPDAAGSTTFDLLTGPDGRIREVRAAAAPSVFQPIVAELLNLKVGPELPEHAQARLLRSAIVNCSDRILTIPVAGSRDSNRAGSAPQGAAAVAHSPASTTCRIIVR